MAFSAKLAAARNGSTEALGEILKECQSYIRAVIARKLPRELRARIPASSLVQETYLRACRRFDTFEGQTEQQLIGWLRKIMLHCLLNILRQPEFRRRREELPPDLAEANPSPPKEAADKECALALERALGRLPTNYRLVIELHHFERLTFGDIGRLLDCTAEAARKLWVRAQAKLGEELEAFQ